jgi:hypothetical protein
MRVARHTPWRGEDSGGDVVTMRAPLVPLALAIAACRAGGGPALPSTPAVDSCFIAPATASIADSLIVAAAGPVDARRLALRPASPADSFAFAQVYETLVGVSCAGRLIPGLAERWEGDGSGRVWRLFLRADATFSDGTPVTAREVAAAWRERRGASAPQQDPRAIAVEGVAYGAEREITVHFRDPHPDGPRPLADPYFALHRSVTDSAAPLGTGPYLAPAVSNASGPASAGLTQAVLIPREPGTAPRIVLRPAPSDDARDLIDLGVDVLLTSDRRTADYAATRPDLRTLRLSHDRSYVLLSAARSSSDSAIASEDSRWAPLRSAIARDVVRSEAAPSTSPWLTASQLERCGDVVAAAVAAWNAPTTSARRLAYAADDRLAGEIAERLVALASYGRGTSAEGAALQDLLPSSTPGAPGPLVAAALSDMELSRSLARGTDLGYLIALPHRALDACAAWRSLRVRAPWIIVGTPILIAETGPTLITSARAPALRVQWDNTLRIVARRDSARSPR